MTFDDPSTQIFPDDEDSVIVSKYEIPKEEPLGSGIVLSNAPVAPSK